MLPAPWPPTSQAVWGQGPATLARWPPCSGHPGRGWWPPGTSVATRWPPPVWPPMRGPVATGQLATGRRRFTGRGWPPAQGGHPPVAMAATGVATRTSLLANRIRSEFRPPEAPTPTTANGRTASNAFPAEVGHHGPSGTGGRGPVRGGRTEVGPRWASPPQPGHHRGPLPTPPWAQTTGRRARVSCQGALPAGAATSTGGQGCHASALTPRAASVTGPKRSRTDCERRSGKCERP